MMLYASNANVGLFQRHAGMINEERHPNQAVTVVRVWLQSSPYESAQNGENIQHVTLMVEVTNECPAYGTDA